MCIPIGIQFIFLYKSHIWDKHPGEIEEIESTPFESLIDQPGLDLALDETVEVDEETEPQAAKGVRINLFSCLEQSLLEQTMNRLDFSTVDRSILEDTICEDTINEANVSFEDSLIKSIGIELDTSKDVSTLHSDVQKGKF